MAKIPKDVRDKIIDECGAGNLLIAAGSGVSAGVLTFVIMLAVLINNKEER